MAVLSNVRAGWSDVDLPCVVRYRRNAFVTPVLIIAFLFLSAIVCTYWSGEWFAGIPFIVLAATTLTLIASPLRHVRSVDCVLIDQHGLTLHRVDGTQDRIEFKPGAEFLVEYEYIYRSIVYATAARDYRDAQHVLLDVLDVPRGQDIYGLCRLLNDLSSGDARPAGAVSRTVHRRQDWYREPPRLSRAAFAAGMLGLALLSVSMLVALTILLLPLSPFLAKPIMIAIKLGLTALFIYPAYRFLGVGRLRDLGEAATHRNVNGLIWRTAAGPLRLFLVRGTPGRNPFGSEPRF